MALVAWPGPGPTWPLLPRITQPPALTASAAVIDATGEKVGVVGRVWWSDRGSHDIRTIGWRAGPITSAGGSGITVSLQDVDQATGAPSRPDGTQDQTVGVLLSALTAAGWNSQTLTADRVGVANGAPLGVVWEYDGGGRLGADSLAVSAVAAGAAIDAGTILLLFTAAWAEVVAYPILVLIAADGTIGTLGLGLSWKTVNTHTYNNASSPDELANQFILPGPATVEGISLPILAAAAADVSLILYSGTTPVETLAIDEDVGPYHANAARVVFFPFATPRDWDASTTYRVGIQPTTANNVSVYSVDVNTAAYLDLIGGQNAHYWDRVDAGAWANETLTRVILMRLHFSRLSDAGAGGGLRLAGHGGLVA